MFEIKTTKSTDKNKISFSILGQYEFVGRSSENNGVQGYVDNLGYKANPKNTFSLVQVGESVCLFRQTEWYASQNIFILLPRINELSKTSLYVTTSINRALYKYKSAYVYPVLNDIKQMTIKLPINNCGIDFDFMEEFIAELEAQRVAELEAYLKVTGLKDYNLTLEEKIALNNYNDISFETFDLLDIFDVRNTHNLLSSDIVKNSGSVPYLCASTENNSVNTYITYDEKYKEKGDCIFIGGKTFVVSYQEKDFFSNDSHNLALYYRGEQIDKLTKLFLVTCINKSLGYKYSWDNSISKTKIRKDKISLAVKNKKIDFSMASILISAIQKLVIKDVVLSLIHI